MEKYSVLNIFLTVSVLSCLCHGWEVQVPGSVTAVEGSCVTLPCRTSSHSHVVWYLYRRSSSPVVYSRNTGDIIDEFRGRTSVPGDPAQGDCSLKIDRVRPEDEVKDLYPWIHPNTGNKFHRIKINVVKPEMPHISIESQQVEGTLFSANCTIHHSCPSSPPPVEWIGLSNVSNNVTTVQNQDGLWTSVFQAQFRPKRQDHEKNLSCQSIFGGQSTSSEALQINVLYAPSDVRIQAEGSVIEGGSLSLTCSGTSRPSPSHYEWSVSQMNTTVKSNVTERRYTLHYIKRDTSVSCTVYNSVGQGQSEKLELDVHFPPKILPSSNCSEWAGGLRCVCRAEAKPKANISWTVDGSRARFPHFNTTTSYIGRVAVSELTGPLTHNVSCTASNYLQHMTVQIPVPEGTAFLQGISHIAIIAAVAAGVVVCVTLGMIKTAVHLRKRRQILPKTTSSQHAGSYENVSKTADTPQGNLYANDAKNEDLYANTMEMSEVPTEKDKMDDIYENC